jgi:hypothetical protein
MRRSLLLLVTFVAVMSFTGSAYANNPTENAYGGLAGDQQAQVGQQAQVQSGSLPFTGWDGLLIVGVGAALTGTGLIVRRATKS